MIVSQNIQLLNDELICELFQNVLPFWTKYSHDTKHGGFFTCLDEDGKIYDSRKYVWLQGRQVWMYSKICNFYDDQKILELSKGVFTRNLLKQAAIDTNQFLFNHAFQKDGKNLAYFCLTEDGKPNLFQRKIFSATFIIMGAAELAKLTSDIHLRKKAIELFYQTKSWVDDPSIFERPQLEGAEQSSALNVPMIMLNVIDELKASNFNNDDMSELEKYQDLYAQMMLKHVHPTLNVFLENVRPDGSFLPGWEGRLLNPGHSIEAAWFLLVYAQNRQNKELIEKSLLLMERSFELGWNKKNGGIIYFVDIEGFSPVQLEANLKLWWPQNEAMIAFAMAYRLTKDEKYLKLFEQIWQFCKNYMSDKKNGEWFGYINEHNEVTHRFKGGPYKGCFHIPRALLYCSREFELIK